MTMTDELSARAIHERHMRESLEYRREYERTRFANDVAVRVVQYRAEHGLSQTALAKLLDMHQPAIARLEAGEHEPSLTTLSRLAQVLGEDFSVDIKPDRMELRSAGLSRARLEHRRGRATAALGRPPAEVSTPNKPRCRPGSRLLVFPRGMALVVAALRALLGDMAEPAIRAGGYRPRPPAPPRPPWPGRW